MSPRVLVLAKAPYPGLVKTRLGADIGLEAAAELAAAALLDTLEVCAAAFGDQCFLALDGDLSGACRGTELLAAVQGWTVFAQEGDGLAARLAHAHLRVAEHGPGSVVQIGMDTPQVTGADLRRPLRLLDHGVDAVLGTALDGGWWALALADPRRAAALVGVPMSVPDTAIRTAGALADGGATVASETGRLRDVDTVPDAAAVAALAPQTRFARAWHACAVVAS